MAESSKQGRRNSRQEPPDNRSPYDKLTKRELVGIQNYNDNIIRDHFAQGVEVSKSVYLQQVLAEQQQIEARLAMLEQQPDERDLYLQSLPPLPEYILSVKSRAARGVPVLRGRNRGMSLEEAAMIERDYAKKTQRKRPARQKEFGAVSEKEKHAIIMEYMNHKESDDEEEYNEEEDEKEYWYDDGKVADEDNGAVGGEWVDSNDVARMIAVDRDRIAAGGFYTNFVDES